ncbi:IscS subfamily cysteine desulfurase [Sodalis sp. CWE]|uniref:IscS subfamily cysteine desulfurase n=1 Tax=Sodalis sp. CWE TaxID=2803816 RepID=UPI001C7CA757|nr:IscS subfamily cysteine desulfurase [Sodalis sp. CWE]MBX4181017.1 IscS subfamily cysteine desulfurase [Sodalis sp. CWE]
MKLPIYLDYSSTTPADPQVAEKMMQYLTIKGVFGNPASRSHYYGWLAEEAVDIARNHVAKLIGSDSREIIFTSGATESNNLALKGAAYANLSKGRHIITAMTEHKAVLETCWQLEKEGFSITRLSPAKNGSISLDQLSDALRDDTILVSLMHVNNETGVIHDIAAFSNLCRVRKVLFHSDATQSIGKLPIDLAKLPVDLMSFSGHKIYGPKGIGGLFIRRTPPVRLKAQIHGGNQEQGIRAGTLPVHQIVGMGEACRIAAQKIGDEMPRLKILRNQLWEGLNQVGGVILNGTLHQNLATILNVSFKNVVDSELLILALKNLAVSTGSACISSTLKPSYVLRAMGIEDTLAHCSIRFSLGRFTTSEEIEYAVNQVKKAITKLRSI